VSNYIKLTAENQHSFADLMRQAKRINLDLETAPKDKFRHYKDAALCPHTGRARLLSICVSGEAPRVADLEITPWTNMPDVVGVLTAAKGPPVCAFNAKFDLAYLLAEGVRVPQHRIRCLMVIEQILMAGRRRRVFGKEAAAEDLDFSELEGMFDDDGPAESTEIKFAPFPMGLADVTKRRLGIERDKELQTSDFSGRISEAQLAYAGEDTEHMDAIADQQDDELAEGELEHVADLDCRVVWTSAWMYLTGLLLSETGWPALIEEVAAATKAKETALLQSVNAALISKGQVGLNLDLFGNFRTDKGNGFKPTSRDDVLAMFKRLGINLPNIKKETLATTSISHPVLDAYREWKGESSLLTSISAYPDHVNPGSGRIHCSWNVAQAATGRFSASKPNLQNIPARGNGAKVRHQIVAKEGYLLVVADLSMIEPRIISILSGDKLLLKTFAEGKDAYKVTASIINGCRYEEVTAEMRKNSKPVLLGLMYGLSAARLQIQAKVQYGITMSLAQAEEIREKFFAAFVGLADYHRIKSELARTPGHEYLEVRSLFGRRRVVEHDQRRFTVLTNSETQMSAACCMKQALADLPWRLGKAQLRKTRPVACVHDEIVMESIEAEAPIATRILEITMEQACNQILNNAVPCPVEGARGLSWGEAKP